MMRDKLSPYYTILNEVREEINPSIQEAFATARLVKGADIVERYIPVYKNPTLKELKNNINRGSRGWISPGGDLYLEGFEGEGSLSNIDHGGILKIISLDFPKVLPSSKIQNAWRDTSFGVAVQRHGNTDKFYLGESLSFPIDKVYAKGCIEKAEKKNPALRFYLKSITDIQEHQDTFGYMSDDFIDGAKEGLEYQ